MFTKPRFILSTPSQVVWADSVSAGWMPGVILRTVCITSLNLHNNPERKGSFCTVRETDSTAKRQGHAGYDCRGVGSQGYRNPVSGESWKREAKWVLGILRLCLGKGPVLTHPTIREQHLGWMEVQYQENGLCGLVALGQRGKAHIRIIE